MTSLRKKKNLFVFYFFSFFFSLFVHPSTKSISIAGNRNVNILPRVYNKLFSVPNGSVICILGKVMLVLRVLGKNG